MYKRQMLFWSVDSCAAKASALCCKLAIWAGVGAPEADADAGVLVPSAIVPSITVAADAIAARRLLRCNSAVIGYSL